MSLFVRRPFPSQPYVPRCRRPYHNTPKPSKANPFVTTGGPRKPPNLTIHPSVELPNPDLWRETFAYNYTVLRDRVSVKNPGTAEKLAKSFIYWNWNKMDEKQEPSNTEENMEELDLEPEPPIGERRGKVVIEAFPGPGALTRALMRLPKERIRKLIVLEDNESYYNWLKPLEQVDPRVKVLQHSGYSWETYEVIEELGLLDDVKKQPWEQVHDELHFISHVPTNIMGEQLIAQFFRCIPDRQWLYKFGRMPMSIILGAWMWKRISAPPATSERCKVSVVAEATSAFTSSLPPSSLLPYDAHFHPVFTRESRQSKPELRRNGSPLVSINMLPFAKQVIEQGALDKWDFCLRRLFVLKSTAIGKAIGSLAPGSTTLIKYLSDDSLPSEERLDLKKQINKLTVKDWALVLAAFEKWPFAPEDLLISDAFTVDREQGKRF